MAEIAPLRSVSVSVAQESIQIRTDLPDAELKEINNVVLVNYLSAKCGKDAPNAKVQSKYYKPKILSELEDESFLYGPLYEGPVSFVRTDEQFRNWFSNKISKYLPDHPNKHEKEYYKDEYSIKKDIKEDITATDYLIKRDQRNTERFNKIVEQIIKDREEEARRIEEEIAAAKKAEEEKKRLAEERKKQEEIDGELIIPSNSPNGRVKAKSKACLDRTYLLAYDDENAVICECKYTEDPFDEKQLKDLQNSALCVTQQNKSYIIFSKNGVSSGVEKHLKNLSGYSVITLDDLFKIESEE